MELTVDAYLRLPPVDRTAVDVWREVNGLADVRALKVLSTDGRHVEVTQCQRNQSGRRFAVSGRVATVRRTVVCTAMPFPMQVFPLNTPGGGSKL